MVRLPDVKRSFVTGLLLLAPLAVTLYVLRLLAGWSVGVVDPVVEGTRLASYTDDNVFVAQVVAGLAIVGVVVVLGAIAQWSVGQRLFGTFGRAVNLIPLVDTIYSSVRQVASALVDADTRYDRVVLVEYPREGIYCVGLVTSSGPEPIEAVTGKPTATVYLPNSPNPTGGRLLMVPEDDIHEVDMSVRRGLRLLVTTGMGSEAVSAEALEDGSQPETPASS